MWKEIDFGNMGSILSPVWNSFFIFQITSIMQQVHLYGLHFANYDQIINLHTTIHHIKV